jgi:hypothetical protein
MGIRNAYINDLWRRRSLINHDNKILFVCVKGLHMRGCVEWVFPHQFYKGFDIGLHIEWKMLCTLNFFTNKHGVHWGFQTYTLSLPCYGTYDISAFIITKHGVHWGFQTYTLSLPCYGTYDISAFIITYVFDAWANFLNNFFHVCLWFVL